MTQFAAKHSESKIIKSNILSIAAEAQEAKKENPFVIDGTIGMLFSEEGKLLKFKSVITALDELTDMEKYAYSQTAGTEQFKEGILRWSFRGYYDEITSKMYCDVIATPGGSGAVSSTIGNYLNPNDKLLTSDFGWGPYAQMAKENFTSVEYYSLFDESFRFNFDDYKKHADLLIKDQGRLLSIINDPCHNPTGFALELDDWKKIINHANNAGVPVVIFLDMAYIDYLPKGIDASREVIKEFLNINDNVMVILGFSGSKTFSVYGMRVGAQVCIAKTKEAQEEFFRINEFSARSRWSNINHAGLALVEKIILNDTLRTNFENELKDASFMLMERALMFMDEANKIDLHYYPYKGGFFLTVPCNGEKTYNNLKKEGIFVVPLKKGIRISLSALPKRDIQGLAKKIQNALE